MAFTRLHFCFASSLILALTGACSSKPGSQAQAPSPDAVVKPVLSSSLDQIQNLYASDRAAAERKYAANAVQFTAIAATVAPEAADAVAVAFTTAQHPEPVTAHFSSTPEHPATAIKPGAMVQARCNAIAVVAGKIELTGCNVR